MYSSEYQRTTDIELIAVDYEDNAIVPGQGLPVALTLKNNGLTTISSISISSDYTGDNSSVVLGSDLKPGQTTEIEYIINVPASFNSLTDITFSVTCEDDSVSENNTRKITIGYTDLTVNTKKNASSGLTSAGLTIVNNSCIDTDAMVRLYKDNYEGQLLVEYIVLDIPAFSNKVFYLNSDVLNSYYDYGDTVCVEVVAMKEEKSTGDNRDFFTIDTPETDLYSYTVLEDNKIRIDKYNGTDTNLVIPENYDDYTVSSLAANVVPAFVNSITLPSGLETVTATTFNSATGLTEINVDENNTVFTSKDGILYSADGTKVIRCPIAITNKTIVLSDDVIEIAGYAFADVGMTSVVLPESLQIIRNYAFSNNSITTLTIPEAVTRIECNSFEKCNNLTEINYNAVNAETGIPATGIFAQIFISYYAVFNSDSAIQTINIGESVQSLSSGLFVNLSGLNTVNIASDSNLSSIAAYTFLGDSALSDIYYGRYYKYWKQISISDGNAPITNATLHCVECNECTWDEGRITTAATCVSTGVKLFICTVCEKERTEIVAIDPNNHVGETSIINQKDPTCTQEGYTGDTICADCKVVLESGTSIPKTEHTWDTGTITQSATCTETGVKTFSCLACPATRTETIDALGHDVSAEWTIDKEPTCTESGTKSHHCSRCDFKTNITDIDALGHNWDQGEVTTPATCTETGIRTYTCSTCQDTKTETIDALNHDYGDWMQFSESQHQRVCKNDFSHIETENHSWNDGVVTKEASCTENGIRTYTCSVCGATKTDSINAIGHNYGKWTKLNENQHQRVCANDPSHIEKENHSWNIGAVTKATTCTEAGIRTYTCTVCAAKKTETINATGHNYGAWVLVKAPTCTEAGLEQRVCANDSNHIETRSITKLAHDDRDGNRYCDSCNADLSSVGETQESNCVCGKYHTGPFAGFIKFFHKIVYFFKNLFGKN